MGAVISFANQKGGVAKTTSTYNVGVSLARKKQKTLIIDLDSQASLTISAGLEPFEIDKSIVNVLSKDSVPIKDCLIVLQENLHIVTSRLELAQLEIEMIGRSMREKILHRAIGSLWKEYDYILIDCPPQLSILTINALAASNFVIIPVKTDYLAYRGVELLQDTIQEIQSIMNSSLEVLGVIATIYEKKVKDDNDILKALQEKYNVIGVVKKSVIAKKGVYEGRSVSEQKPDNEIAIEYDKISDYIMEKGGL